MLLRNGIPVGNSARFKKGDVMTIEAPRPASGAAWRLNVYKDRRGEWRWTLFARNGRKLANSGEGYKRMARCRAAAHRIFPWF